MHLSDNPFSLVYIDVKKKEFYVCRSQEESEIKLELAPCYEAAAHFAETCAKGVRARARI